METQEHATCRALEIAVEILRAIAHVGGDHPYLIESEMRELAARGLEQIRTTAAQGMVL